MPVQAEGDCPWCKASPENWALAVLRCELCEAHRAFLDEWNAQAQAQGIRVPERLRGA